LNWKRYILWPAIGVLSLFAVLILTLLVFRFDLGISLQAISKGAVGDKYGIARTLVRATPLTLCGLGIAVAWKAGMFNIGGEGQYLLGALAGAYLFKIAGTAPAPAFQILAALGAILAGGGLALLAGWLQIKRGVQIVVSTILLNFIVIQFLDWSVRGPAQEAARQLPLSDQLPREMLLAKPDAQTDLHLGVLLVPIAALLVFFWFYRTRDGFKLRLVGENPHAARAQRISSPKHQLIAMFVSGGLCGLAGSVDYLGIIGNVGKGSAQNWGFLAIPVALIGGLHPAGVVASGLYFGALMSGCEGLARSNPAGNSVVYVVQAAAVLGYVAFDQIRRHRQREAVD
jgi:simple sugar transport system permease protein